MAGRMMRGITECVMNAFATRRKVKIADCVHFCAYRYGRGELNPYEQYAFDLAAGIPEKIVREKFANYLRHFRPRHLSEALGVQLSREYPLWWLPWRTPAQVRRSPGWNEPVKNVVDVMTHFSSAGIPRAMMEREYCWHEQAFEAMRLTGYRPADFSYITARELRGTRTAYLVTDGNHRLSALSALGSTDVEIQVSALTVITRDRVERWPLVRSGMMTPEDALSIFDAYVDGHQTPMRTQHPASLV